MDLKHPKWAIGVLCALLALMGCPINNDDEDTNPDNTTTGNLELTLVGSYGVAHPNVTGSQTNYVVLAVDAGDYSKGTYTLNKAAATATPVLSEGGRVTLIKIAAPAGGGGGGGNLPSDR